MNNVRSLLGKAKEDLMSLVIVSVAFFVALSIRIRPADSVFLPNGFVRFSNDPLYHMRMVEVLLHNYPQGMFYNPLTNYPQGSFIHFGPLFDHMIAITALVIGLGNPGTGLLNTIGAYFPTVLGALLVFPVYFLGKHLKDRKTGVIAAILISITPGQFLNRSMIIFTDHHVAETLFSTLFILFFMLAMIQAKKANLSVKMLEHMDKQLAKPLVYAILAGVMYAAYQLTWAGAPLFGMIIVIFAAIQYSIDHVNNRSTDYLGIVGIITFLVGLLLVLPFIHFDMGVSIYYYSWFHLLSALAAMAAFVYMSLVHKEINRRKLNPLYYPLVLMVTIIVALIALRIVSPSVYYMIIATPAAIFKVQTGGFSTVGEVSSIFYRGGSFTLSSVWYNFAMGFFISIIAMFMLAYSIRKEKRPEQLLVLVWTFIMLLAIYGQNRFAYYYAINVALLSGYFAAKVLDMVGWRKIETAYHEKVHSVGELPHFLSKNVKAGHLLTIFILLLLVAYPSYSLAMEQSQYASGANGYWLESLFWMRDNTPDPGIDFLQIYEAPESGERFGYPDSAYGVMSWWDYGHEIEAIARRLPNANPFQAGIGGRSASIDEENRPGAAPFFTAPSEEEATAVLEAIHPDPDKAAARYIISDVEMATGKFYAMTAWTMDTEGYYVSVQTDSGAQYVPGERYYNSMEARLHIFDGDGLQQYRLVHESPEAPTGYTSETGYKNVYNVLYGGNLELTDTGYVKVFEYVEGATITGNAPTGETVTISNTIETNQGRSFTYSQSAISDGAYSFTVPYSTEGPIPGETQFDVRPTGPYTISYGNTTQQVSVSEPDVLNGNVIEV
ncbi:oligosaccharyl transferase, archaeosortase A system-associated [Methanolobus chelungpuianus]|uniref:dolichyl-phosphooligosaccharide-protein glycotransferase n=1 Tax=Methanolobus chelungpuianus TaxID=502115 RepID=A0AAE3HAS8_9EURY|nr:oligosaccharyl transferase, archaeosortase A system-associated [Methanolobus chelungpuianus]MCQ6962757.1 oligosaccharyl transferase [Methanolobus chelungpuianus]